MVRGGSGTLIAGSELTTLRTHYAPLTPRSGGQGIYQQHRSGHRSDAAGDRGDGSGHLLDTVEIDIADQAIIVEPIDADVDDGGARA